MKIGIWVDGPFDKHSGGSFTYNHTLITGIDNYSFDKNIEMVFISLAPLSNFNKPVFNIQPHQKGISIITKAFRKLLKITAKETFRNTVDRIDQKEKSKQDASATAYLKENGIRIIFYPTPASHVISGIPYIVNNWDLGHHTAYTFPEIFDNNGFHNRNSWYTNVMSSALMVFSETETGKKEIAHYLNFNSDRIKVLPIFPSNALISIKIAEDAQHVNIERLGLKPRQFFFYPAQFWAHKNHYNLIRAFKEFSEAYPDFKLLLCGSDKGNLEYLKNYAKELGLQNKVIFTGFIPDETLYSLYKNARALVMPTLLGPSNMPPLEAMQLECPALCSGFEGHKEIMKDAALYFDPLNYLSILECMKAVMSDDTWSQITQNQKKQANLTDHTIEKALMALDAHLTEAINIRNCWP